MSKTPMVSIVLTTFNRAQSVKLALQSLQAQDYPFFEILAVDNNSTDNTAAAVQRVAEGDPRVRYLLQPTPGVGPARNLGCQEAQGELLAFLDDDEVAPPEWLSRLVQAQAESQAAGVGGPYEPMWETSPPKWLLRSRCMQETLSFMDFGAQAREVDWLLGGNAIYTREALAAVGYFGTIPGRTGLKAVSGGGDMAAGLRLRKAGHRLWFEPSARVYHTVPPERMRLNYILRRAFWAGYDDVAIGQEWHLCSKAASATKRGPDALALGMLILPGVLWGRLMVRLGRLQPQVP
jgi:glucosyl-dolichyl phosphate glucuronosyltransferase